MMKSMTRMLSVFLSVLLTLTLVALPLCVFAEDDANASGEEPTETVAEAEPSVTLEKNNVLNIWNEEILGDLFKSGCNQTAISYSEEGLVLTYTGTENDSPDPYITFPVSNYYKKFNASAISPAEASYIVIKLKSTGTDGDIECFAKPEPGDSVSCFYEADGEWQYIVLDMWYTSLVDSRRVTSFRLDWSAGATEVGATMTIAEIAFFEDEDKAYAYPNDVVEGEESTEAPTEKATDPATEPATETQAPATEAPAATDAVSSDKGCSSVAMTGAAVVVLGVAAVVALKRKKD